MSMRCRLSVFESIEPLRAAVGSGDETLCDAVLAAIEKRHGKPEAMSKSRQADYRAYKESAAADAKQLVNHTSPRRPEVGGWNEVLELLAGHYQLHIKADLDFNEKDYKHVWVWADYLEAVRGVASESALELLTKLEDGRALVGESIDCDGSTYAWLAADEVTHLDGQLAAVEAANLSDDDLVEFHEDLRAALALAARKKAALFLTAM